MIQKRTVWQISCDNVHCDISFDVEMSNRSTPKEPEGWGWVKHGVLWCEDCLFEQLMEKEAEEELGEEVLGGFQHYSKTTDQKKQGLFGLGGLTQEDLIEMEQEESIVDEQMEITIDEQMEITKAVLDKLLGTGGYDAIFSQAMMPIKPFLANPETEPLF